jgi:hypothetical protein
MRKIYLSLLLTFISYLSIGQSVTINPAPTSTTQLNGLGSSNYHVSEYIYTDAEIGSTNFTSAGTAINQINLNMTATSDKPNQVFTNVKIYLKEVSAATTGFSAGTYSTAGYTQVFSGSFPATTVGWTGVFLNTPFVRTSGMNLQMMIERTDNVLPYTATAPPTWQSTTGVATGSRRYNGTAALSGTTSLATSAHRVAVQFKHALANDVSVGPITGAGKLPVGYGGSQDIVITVSNAGTAALTNVPVTLNVTGANTFSTSQNIASLAVGASTVVTFNTFTPTAIGNNVVTISVPSDEDNTNNSSTMNLVTTSDTYSPANNDAFTPGASIGFNTGSGILAVQLPVNKNNTLFSVRTSISTETSVVGNTVYGVLLSSTGSIIAQSANYTLQSSDLGNYVTFTFPSLPAVTAGSTYYIGLAQTANATTGYYPVNTQSSKPNNSYSTPLAGGTITNYTNFGSLMIEGVFSSVFPVKLVSFTGVLKGEDAILNWSTVSEINNNGFEIQRSLDGASFSAAGFVAGVGNSSNVNTYQFADRKIALGDNYYRLKQIDKDGRFEYSSIIKLNRTAKGTFEITIINPSKGKVLLQVNSETDERASLTLHNLSGQLIATKNTEIRAGSNSLSNGENLSKGVYIVNVNKKGERSSYKVVVD